MIAAVFDNTVLSNFAHTQQPQLLQAAFDQPVTVEAVMAELTIGVQLGRIPAVDWDWMPIIALTEQELAKADALGHTLGRGEAQCLALAVERGGMVITDDRTARRTARSMGILVSGTLGTLMNLVGAHILSLAEADKNLTLMREKGYRSPVNSLSELLD